jgi:hypothetical protein
MATSKCERTVSSEPSLCCQFGNKVSITIALFNFLVKDSLTLNLSSAAPLMMMGEGEGAVGTTSTLYKKKRKISETLAFQDDILEAMLDHDDSKDVSLSFALDSSALSCVNVRISCPSALYHMHLHAFNM